MSNHNGAMRTFPLAAFAGRSAYVTFVESLQPDDQIGPYIHCSVMGEERPFQLNVPPAHADTFQGIQPGDAYFLKVEALGEDEIDPVLIRLCNPANPSLPIHDRMFVCLYLAEQLGCRFRRLTGRPLHEDARALGTTLFINGPKGGVGDSLDLKIIATVALEWEGWKILKETHSHLFEPWQRVAEPAAEASVAPEAEAPTPGRDEAEALAATEASGGTEEAEVATVTEATVEESEIALPRILQSADPEEMPPVLEPGSEGSLHRTGS